MPKIRNIAPIAMSDLFPSDNIGGTLISKAASIQRKPVTFLDRRTLLDFMIIFLLTADLWQFKRQQ